MVIQFLAANIITGVSGDTKPTTVPTNSRFFETNTQRWFLFDATDWNTEINVPIAEDTFYISTQAELELIFPNLEIPDATSAVIILLNDMTFDKPIKLGVGTNLFMQGTPFFKRITLDNTLGSDPFFQPTTPGTLVGNLALIDLEIIGTGVQTIFDLDATFGVNLFQFEEVIFFDIKSIGRLGNAFMRFTFCGYVNYDQGIIFEDPFGVNINDFFQLRLTGTPPVSTGIIIKSSVATNVRINEVTTSFLNATDAIIFLDPSSTADTTFFVENSVAPIDQLFQQGSDIAISLVEDNGVGFTRFTTVSPHNLVIGQAVVIKDFVTQTTYNKTAIVTAIPTTTTFDVEINFVVTDTGTMNAASLDSTDIRVIAQNNPNSPDSMVIGGFFHSTNVASTPVLDGTFSPLNLSTSGGVTAFTENERFNIFDANNGTLQYFGTTPKTLTLITVLNIEKVTGGTSNYNLRYAIDRGELVTAAVDTGGTGYVDAESVTLTGQTSGATNATATITVVAGIITAINIVSSGDKYEDGETLDVIGGTGTGGTGTATILGFVALPTPIERLQAISTTARDTVLNQEVVMTINDRLRMEIEGVGIAVSVNILFASLDIKA